MCRHSTVACFDASTSTKVHHPIHDSPCTRQYLHDLSFDLLRRPFDSLICTFPIFDPCKSGPKRYWSVLAGSTSSWPSDPGCTSNASISIAAAVSGSLHPCCLFSQQNWSFPCRRWGLICASCTGKIHLRYPVREPLKQDLTGLPYRHSTGFPSQSISCAFESIWFVAG